MNIEQVYRQECDTIRLLIEEFRHVGAEYFIRNRDIITSIEVHDANEYVKPKAIPSILGFLAGSLLIHIISLLDFRLPRLVIYRIETAAPNSQVNLKSRDNVNVLDWMKEIVRSSEGFNFDFSDSLYERLRAWILVRNDEVHNGGYRSNKVTRHHIEILRGVNAGNVGSLYDIQFAACEQAIDDVQNFFQKTYDTLVYAEHKV